MWFYLFIFRAMKYSISNIRKLGYISRKTIDDLRSPQDIYFDILLVWLLGHSGLNDILSSCMWTIKKNFCLFQPLIDSDLASLTWSFFKQSFLKQLLTEGKYAFFSLFSVSLEFVLPLKYRQLCF